MSGNISNIGGYYYSDDPFQNAEQVDTQPDSQSTSYLANVEDISDDDFEIPSSQRHLQNK